MPAAIGVLIHPSQFPENVQRDLLDSLRTRRINHKFHYESVKQTEKWLALHEAFSPARTDSDCVAAYDRGFEETIRKLTATQVHLVGLGCGGGQKDTRLLCLLRDRGISVQYSPVDVSVPMVLTAYRTALAPLAAEHCHPIVCDLLTATDLDRLLECDSHRPQPRIVTFFGMIPNFEPQIFLPRLVRLVRPGDYLLFSANLAPGPDYAAGARTVLPQYDNELTRDWLLTFLLDLGVERGDGESRFFIEDCPGNPPLKRITCEFRFHRTRRIVALGEAFTFQGGDTIRLFFSYRYQPSHVRALLAGAGLKLEGEWLTPSQEEGVFACRNTPERMLTTGDR
jgi:uncharacterized SAM-dependent methyltransferase